MNTRRPQRARRGGPRLKIHRMAPEVHPDVEADPELVERFWPGTVNSYVRPPEGKVHSFVEACWSVCCDRSRTTGVWDRQLAQIMVLQHAERAWKRGARRFEIAADYGVDLQTVYDFMNNELEWVWPVQDADLSGEYQILESTIRERQEEIEAERYASNPDRCFHHLHLGSDGLP